MSTTPETQGPETPVTENPVPQPHAEEPIQETVTPVEPVTQTRTIEPETQEPDFTIIEEAAPGVEFTPPKRGRGRPRKDGTAPQPKPVQVESIPVPEKSKFNAAKAQKAGEYVARVIIGITGNINPDFAPHTPQEVEMAGDCIKSTGEYFVSKEIPDLPPGVTLALCWASYFGAIAIAERNRPKVQNLWDKFKLWRAHRKAVKELKKAGGK